MWLIALHARVQEIRRRLRISETAWLFLLASVAGLLAGLGSIVFHYLIAAIQWLAFGSASVEGPLDAVSRAGFSSARLLLAPAVGGLVVGPLIHFFAREAKGHGVPAVVRSVHERGGRISPAIALVKTIASAVTLGSGGSLGREGPVVQIGASIGSGVGQLLGVTPKQLKMLAAAGAAAGLAAIFNAPLGGAFFALEVIVGSFAMEAFGPIVVASVSATLVSRAILGDHPVIAVASYELEHVHELLVYVALGLACGGVAVLFTRGIALATAAFERVPTPEWMKPAIGGAAVGFIALDLTPRILGNGYETVDAIMSHRPIETLLLVLIAAKLVATCLTLGSGGSGGVFGPTLFLGAVLGALIGKTAGFVLPVAPPAAYALVGMAALVAGATHAPVSMVLMVFEMSDNYRIVLPLLIATSISSAVARRLYRESVDTVLDAQKGRLVHKNVALHGIPVVDAAHLGDGVVVAASASLDELVQRFLTGGAAVLAVVDRLGKYRGMISAETLRACEHDEAMPPAVVALDLVRLDVPQLSPRDPLTRAVDAFHGAGIEALPIVEPGDGRFIGLITEGDIVAAYRRAVLRSEILSTTLRIEGTASGGSLRFGDGTVTTEIACPPWLAGRTLAEVQLRSRFGVSVLAVRSSGAVARAADPKAPIRESERIVIVGSKSSIEKLQANADEPVPASEQTQHAG
jgi:CIC family chloride channel protein